MDAHGAAAIWDQIAAAIRILHTHGSDAATAREAVASGIGTEQNALPTFDYQLTLIGTSGREIAVEVMPSTSDEEAVRDARGLFGEYPSLAEIVVKRNEEIIARLSRD
jgi:hypothetical protein